MLKKKLWNFNEKQFWSWIKVVIYIVPLTWNLLYIINENMNLESMQKACIKIEIYYERFARLKMYRRLFGNWIKIKHSLSAISCKISPKHWYNNKRKRMLQMWHFPNVLISLFIYFTFFNDYENYLRILQSKWQLSTFKGKVYRSIFEKNFSRFFRH